MMRLAFFTEVYPPHVGGCETRFSRIARGLASRGNEVHVYTTQSPPDSPDYEASDGVHVHRFHMPGTYIGASGSRPPMGVLKYSVASAIRSGRDGFDLCYLSQWPMLHTILSGPICSAALVQEWCEVWDRTVISLLGEVVASLCRHHAAVSRFTKRRVIEVLGIPPRDVLVIPNGVDFSAFSGQPSRKVWGRVVYVGRLVPHKNVDMLIEAFSVARALLGDGLELHIVGCGPLADRLRFVANRTPGCLFHGYLPDAEMRRVLESSWIFVSPSEREGSGITILEAMAAGTPVLVPDFRDNAARELVDGCNGVVFKPPDSRALADAMVGLYRDEDGWRGMSKRCRVVARSFDWDRIVREAEIGLAGIVEDSRG